MLKLIFAYLIMRKIIYGISLHKQNKIKAVNCGFDLSMFKNFDF